MTAVVQPQGDGESSRRLLDKPKVLVPVTLFCLIETVWSWADVSRGVLHRVDPITALFSAFLMVIAVNITYKFSLWVDRIVFAGIAGAFAFAAVSAAPLAPAAMFAVEVAYGSMWTIAGSVGLVVLVLGRIRSRGNNIPR